MNENAKPKIWKNLKSRMLVIAVAVAGIAAFLTNTGTILNFVKGWFGKKDMEITDLSFTSRDSVDIKIRNTGNEVLILKGIVLTLKKKWILVPGSISKSYMEATHGYGLMIDSSKSLGDTSLGLLSQSIGPNQSDRFFIHLSAAQYNPDTCYVYQFGISFLYNGNKSAIAETNVLFAAGPEPEDVSYASEKDSALNARNRGMINEIKNIPGTQNDLVKSILKTN
jgi:hypothetical protein